jgi:ADP-ribose pyrophosphatase YjhB (NUDIX family)
VKELTSLAHSRALELLPWLVNGTLSGEEREAVEQHARTCIACRRELKEQQRLHAAVRARRTVDVSAEAGFDRLNAELDGAAGTTRPRWRVSYATAAPFAVAAAAGMAVLAILLWFTPLPELAGSRYETLATAPAEDARMLDIVFADDTTAAEMQELLDDIGGKIVAGPSELGRYSVRIAGGQPNGELLAALAVDPRVRFAAPALMEVQP